MTEAEINDLLAGYSHGDVAATTVRRAMGDVGFGDLLIALAQRGLPLPRASQVGREAQIAQAKAWLFPSHE